MEVDPQKFGTETESPELEKATEESASVEEKSDATAIIVPGEGQIEEIEITNKESSGVPQSTTESVMVSEEKYSQVIETNDEPSDKDISVQVCFFLSYRPKYKLFGFKTKLVWPELPCSSWLVLIETLL